LFVDKVNQAKAVKMESKELPDHKVRLGSKVNMVHKERKVHQAPQGSVGYQPHGVPQAHRAHRARQAHRVHQGNITNMHSKTKLLIGSQKVFLNEIFSSEKIYDILKLSID
jgi:hypothetical protein